MINFFQTSAGVMALCLPLLAVAQSPDSGCDGSGVHQAGDYCDPCWPSPYPLPEGEGHRSSAGGPSRTDQLKQLNYSSAFGDYKPWQDIQPADWRELNGTVRDAAAKGGAHAGHGTHAPAAVELPATAPAAPAARASSKPAPADQDAHGNHGHGENK